MRNRMYVNNTESIITMAREVSRDYGAISKGIADNFPIGIQKRC